MFLLLRVLPRVFNFIGVCLHVHIYEPQKCNESGSFGARSKGRCELFDMGADNQTWVLLKNSFLSTKSSLQPKKCGQSCLEFKHFYYLSVWMSMR